MTKSPQLRFQDDEEMRAFYRSVGISPETTEVAIIARRHIRNAPPDQKTMKVKKRKSTKPGSSIGR